MHHELRLTSDQATIVAMACQTLLEIYRGNLGYLSKLSIEVQVDEDRQAFASALQHIEPYITGSASGVYFPLEDLPVEAKVAHDLASIIKAQLEDISDTFLISGTISPSQIKSVVEATVIPQE